MTSLSNVLLHLIRNITSNTIATVIPTKSENISILSVDMALSICEYITDIGVIIKTKYVGCPSNNIGKPVFNLSPFLKL
jgi:hypothetical protein